MGILKAFPSFCIEKRRQKNKITPFLYNCDDPKLPWNKRKEYLLKQISVYPDEWRYKKKDIDRLVKEKLVVRKRTTPLQVRKKPNDNIFRLGNRYTGGGRTHIILVNPLPDPIDKPAPNPYAKRKAGLKEFLEANNL